jgi:two-component system sensor histidine kinase MprB
MTLRRRVGLAAAIAVAIAVVAVAAISYFVVRSQLVGQVDSALRAQARAVLNNPFSLRQTLPVIPASAGGPAPYVQFVTADGTILPRTPYLQLPTSQRVLAVAAGMSGPFTADIRVGGSHLRELVFRDPALVYAGQPDVAIQLARPLGNIDHVLSTLRVILALVCLGGVGLAVILGRLAASRVLAPLAEVAATAQHIGETEDLTSRIQVRTDDEVGQLAMRFNAMLERLEASRDALDESVRAQRQLVADASHELRTPVTSLRTNIELLLEHDQLDPRERRRMLADVVEQTEELTGLVGDLIELARGDLQVDATEDVRLDQVAAESIRRAERNFPDVRFEPRLAPALVEGVPGRLSRVINNLLDNAARHSPPGGVVEVGVEAAAGQVLARVRDHGAGVAEADLPHVFDRFYRGAGARGRQGTGLGLSIVRQVVEQHGGSVTAANAPDGGAIFTVGLPLAAPEAPRAPASGAEPQLQDGTDSGSGWPRDPRLTSDPEALAQEHEADDEHGHHHGEEEAAAQRAAD